MQPILVLHELSIHSSQQCLLHPISFSLYSHQSMTILGQTGAGKSLLMQAILGILPQPLTMKGEIWYWGQALHTLSTVQRRALWGKDLVLLPQEPWHALDPLMTSIEQVSEIYRYVRKQPKPHEQAQSTLNQLGLADAAQHYPYQLSGGMAQRLAFAMAQAAEGNLLLVDEPTKGLDSNNKQDIIQLLQQHTQQGSLLTITHDIEVAEALTGELLVLREGQVIERGITSHVLQHPQQAYTQQLIKADPRYWQPLPALNLAQNFTVLNATQLGLVRGKKRLWQDLNLEIKAGEIIGVTGESGSGKSSLGDVLLGLVSPSEGQVQYAKQVLPTQRLKVYQDPPSAFQKNVPIQTLLNDVVHLHQLDPEQINALLEPLALKSDLLKRNSTELSGGELQRLALLRVLLLRPKFLFADEPSSRLDPITAQTITLLLVEQARQHQCALLLVNHDRHLIEKVADRVLNLDK